MFSWGETIIMDFFFIKHIQIMLSHFILSLEHLCSIRTIISGFLGKETKAQWDKLDCSKHMEFKCELLPLDGSFML